MPNLILIHGAVIEAILTEKEGGKAIPHITVSAQRLPQEINGSSTALGHTDEDGHVRLRVPPGKYQVMAGPINGYVMPPRSGVSVETIVVGTETKTVPIRLSKGLTLSGTVKDEHGTPIANVPLTIRILCGKCEDEGCWNDQNR